MSKNTVALPQGHENSSHHPSPYTLRPMVDPTLTPNHQFDPDMMEGMEIEYGNDGNWKSTFIYPMLPVLANGEELVWNYVKTEGVFNKKAEVLFAITNLRALIYDFKDYQIGNSFLTFVDDIIVTNSHRVSQSNRMGSFSSVGRYGMRVGSYGGHGTSKSQTIGDVIFMKDGTEFLAMREFTDPQGIAKLAKAVKKSVQVRDKIDESTPLVEGSTTSNKLLLHLSELSNQGKDKEIIKICKKEFDENHDDYIFDLLIAKLTEEEDWKTVENYSRKMIQLKNYEYAFEALCTALLSQNKMEEGIGELNKALKIFPMNKVLNDYKQQVSPFEANFLDSKSITCPKCKKENETGSKFCNSCGKKLDEGCVKCGHVNPKNAKFCNDCGYTLK